MRLRQALDLYLPLVEEELRTCLHAEADEPPLFFGMLHYHMGWLDENLVPLDVARGGKRLRPLFAMLCCQAAGGQAGDALPAGAAVEILHNFSLIHDDIQDVSDTRHGRPTVWKLWGRAQAINAGDALFTLAHLALQRMAPGAEDRGQISSMFEVLDRTCLSLCRGQHLDMAFERQLAVDANAYTRMIEGKTAALLGCSGQLGAMAAGADPAAGHMYRRFGEGLGLAFQIQDDILGIWGDAGRTGKPVADDIRSRKKTYPVVLVMGGGSRSATNRLRHLFAQTVLTEEEVAEVVRILDEAGARERSQTMADEMKDSALDILRAAEPEAEAYQALGELADFLVQRTF